MANIHKEAIVLSCAGKLETMHIKFYLTSFHALVSNNSATTTPMFSSVTGEMSEF